MHFINVTSNPFSNCALNELEWHKFSLLAFCRCINSLNTHKFYSCAPHFKHARPSTSKSSLISRGIVIFYSLLVCGIGTTTFSHFDYFSLSSSKLVLASNSCSCTMITFLFSWKLLFSLQNTQICPYHISNSHHPQIILNNILETINISSNSFNTFITLFIPKATL